MIIKFFPINLFLILFFSSMLIGCHTEETLKPDAYPKINFPVSTSMLQYDDDACPYTFQLPNYFTIEKKSKFFTEDVSNECWLNLVCSDLNATIYLSYKKLSPDQSLQKLVEEAYKLTFKHTQKADYIQPLEIDNGNQVQGLLYYVGGDAASNIQFFISDTTMHFVRGALYFYAQSNADSLKPMIDFMISDIEGLLETWRWKNVKE